MAGSSPPTHSSSYFNAAFNSTNPQKWWSVNDQWLPHRPCQWPPPGPYHPSLIPSSSGGQGPPRWLPLENCPRLTPLSPGSPPPGSCVSFSFSDNSPTVGLSRDPLIVSFLLFFNLLSLGKSVHSHGIRQHGDHTSHFSICPTRFWLTTPLPRSPRAVLKGTPPPTKKSPTSDGNKLFGLLINHHLYADDSWIVAKPSGSEGGPGVSPLGLHPVALLARLCDPGQLK